MIRVKPSIVTMLPNSVTPNKTMIKTNEAVLVLIDIQDRLLNAIHNKDRLIQNIVRLIKGIKILGIPIIWMEQYPEGLGQTTSVVAKELIDIQPIRKTTFSAGRNEKFLKKLSELARSNIILCGIETHVCVYQTAADLKKKGYHVEIVADAVSSRAPSNISIGLKKMQGVGVHLTSVETALFELLEIADGDLFKQILRVIK